MKLKDTMHPTLARCNLSFSNKKQALEQISRIASAADSNVRYQDILDRLLQRERLGSTAIGHGIAIPHAQIEGLYQPICTVLTLSQAINFSGDDEAQAVDLIFGLLIPKDGNAEHLNILAELSEKLQNKNFRQTLREAKTNQELFLIASGQISNHA
ncbi:MAG: PTS sugar transporter subunit IIA [Gammaproteobacteria bacterium]|nr:PTS sugar transporter subunit IIA [Gammaproteobacteria bacterium]